MTTRFALVLAALVAVAPGLATAGDVAADCSGFENPELTEALAIIKVRPEGFDPRPEGAVEGCLVVAFGLEKNKRFKKYLAGHNAVVVAQSGGATEAQIASAEAVLTQWYFSKKTYKKSKDPIYYTKIKF
ncbi:MAG: hypothetical protein AAF229_10325 [Pseudomonadota bacterium]